MDIANEIQKNNKNDQLSRFVLPIGPTGQYPILCQIIDEMDISLKNCWFFFMDEYCDSDGNALSSNHPLSFKKIANELLFAKLPEKCGLNEEQVFFPNEQNIGKLEEIITKKGGIDVCYGGIGIHGHIAFNEPERGVKNTSPRKVELNTFTITINAIRANVGGNVENFPKEAFTLGMKQILNAGKIRLYCRNGTPYDWANTVLRISLLGTPNYDYPVTYIRNHSDYIITTDKDTLKMPKYII
jgi:glucosamine-6-phosphate deaminase